MRPGNRRTYHVVATNVRAGRPVRVAVLESGAAPGSWRIWVDRRAVTPPIALPESHGVLSPMAMAESWDGGRPACNRFRYRFDRVSLAGAPGGAWHAARDAEVLQDRGYRVIRRAAASFVAATVQPLPAPLPAPAAERPGAAGILTPMPLRKGFVPAP
jgi:hypothetical protein